MRLLIANFQLKIKLLDFKFLTELTVRVIHFYIRISIYLSVCLNMFSLDLLEAGFLCAPLAILE